VAAKTSTVHKPGKRHRKQEADEHPKSCEKTHLLLVGGQIGLSPAGASVWHDFLFIHRTTANPPSGVHPMKILNRRSAKTFKTVESPDFTGQWLKSHRERGAEHRKCGPKHLERGAYAHECATGHGGRGARDDECGA
jgi:hypothetical protein